MAISDYDKCVLLLPMNGANEGTVWTDLSRYNHTVAPAGGVTTSTSQFKFYGSSGSFGAGRELYVASTHSYRFTFGTGDFEISCYAYPTVTNTVNKVLFDQRDNTNGVYLCVMQAADNRIAIIVSGGYLLYSGSALSLNTWYYITISRVSGTTRIFINGVLAGSVADTRDYIIGRFRIGRSYDNYPFYGYIQDFIVKKGVGRAANFTPPLQLAKVISNSGSGVPAILDAAGDAAVRTIVAVPRNYPITAFSTQSGVDGRYSLQVPDLEYNVIIQDDDAGTQYNDAYFGRVTPL